MKKIIEISSYPKCGNTWLRYIIGQIFKIDPNQDVPDIHQHKSNTKLKMKDVDLANGTYSFYKSHVLEHPNMDCNKIVLIYRHPLDVFFSSMNYFSLHQMKEQFIDGIVKSVDEIVADKQLQYYFDKYCEELGSNYFDSMLGNNSNYQKYLQNAFNNKKVVPIKYEDLIDDPLNTINTLLEVLLPKENFHIDPDVFAEVNKKTKFTNNAFFWKANKNTHKDYLNNNSIDLFFAMNPYFESLGYKN